MSQTSPTLFPNTGCDALEPAPIVPADVIDGAPVARGRQLSSSADGRLTTHHWECTAGTFICRFGYDEIVHIIEGEVRIEDPAGRRQLLRAGDVAHFPRGTSAVWTVPEYVLKFAVLRHPTLAARIAGRLRRALATRTAALAAAPWLELPIPA
jgi:uncharacterized cupin superfamily protein